MTITFKPLHESHFPLLLKWLETPHVKKWWDEDITYTMALIREKYSSYVKGYKIIEGASKPIHAFIIHADQNPIGYIQLYNAYDFPRETSLSGLPKILGAFDLFIGEEAFLKKNLGSEALSAFLKLHGHPYSHILADPDATNIAAIKCYEKAGFKKLEEPNGKEEVRMIWENKNKLRRDPS